MNHGTPSAGVKLREGGQGAQVRLMNQGVGVRPEPWALESVPMPDTDFYPHTRKSHNKT